MDRPVKNIIKTASFRNRFILLAADLVGLYVFYSVAHRIRLGVWIAPDSARLWVLILVAIITLHVMDVYRTEDPETRSQLPLNTFIACLTVMVVSVVFVYTIGISVFIPVFGRGVMPIAMTAFALWAPMWRWLLTRQQKMIYMVDWLVVADRETFDLFSEDCKREFPKMHIQRIDIDSDEDSSSTSLPALGELHRHGLIFSTHTPLPSALAQRLMEIRFSGLPVLTLSEFYEQNWQKLPVLHLKDGWFVQTRGFNLVHDFIGLRVKRMLDLIIATIGGLAVLPVCLVLAIMIRMDSRGGVFYRQTRVGLNGKEFVLYKFRTMVENAEVNGAQWSSPKDSRVTRIGGFLRMCRLDELPQLWNLLKGEMSLIGPRPERPEFTSQLEQEIPYYDLRHLVAPGITGWAQVMYPYGSSVSDARKKLEYDLYYIKNHSLKLDLVIMLKTISVILKRKGI